MNQIFAGLESMHAHGVPLAITQRLRAKFPDKHVMSTKDGLFRVDAWEASGEGRRLKDPGAVVVDPVSGHPSAFHINRAIGWERVEWKTHLLDVFTVTLPNQYGNDRWNWVSDGASPSMDTILQRVLEGLVKEIASLPAAGEAPPPRPRKPRFDEMFDY